MVSKGIFCLNEKIFCLNENILADSLQETRLDQNLLILQWIPIFVSIRIHEMLLLILPIITT